MKFWPLLLTLASSAQALNSHAKSNVAIYWGQNSGGKDYTQKPLRDYCQDDVGDIFIVSFVTGDKNQDGLPATNFANACDGTFSGKPYSLHCPQIGKDIKECQARGKTVLLSVGGAAGTYLLKDDQQGIEFADNLWNMFGNGTSQYRTFDDAVVDGFDLDLETGVGTGYVAFANRMNEHFAENRKVNPCKKMYMAAAPQCMLPERALHEVLELAHIDLVFIQFYNNWCDSANYKWDLPADQQPQFNFDTWDKYVREPGAVLADQDKRSFKNKNAKLYLGSLGNQTASEQKQAYIDAAHVNLIVDKIKQYESFAGVMIWDAGQADLNMQPGGKNFGRTVKDHLKQMTLPQYAPALREKCNCPVKLNTNLMEHGNDDNEQCNSTPPSPPPKSTSKAAPPPPPPSSSTIRPPTPTITTTKPPPPPTTITKSQPPPPPPTTITKSQSPTTKPRPPSTSSTIPPEPVPTDCPEMGKSCSTEGSKECYGAAYAQCLYGSWMKMPCPPGTVCKAKGAGDVDCTFGSIGDNAKCNTEQEKLFDNFAWASEDDYKIESYLTETDQDHFILSVTITTAGQKPIDPNWVLDYHTELILQSTDHGKLENLGNGDYRVHGVTQESNAYTVNVEIYGEFDIKCPCGK